MAISNNQNNTNALVVLVPGMLSPRFVLWLMASRFKKRGFQTFVFQNRYLLRTPEQNAQRLFTQLQKKRHDTVHFVGHSLGGIVIMHLLNIHQQVRENRIAHGRVVLIATPIKGSDFARWLYAKRGFKWLMGRCAVGGLLNGLPETLDGRETGVMYGSARRGMSALIYNPDQPNDGLVNQVETQLDAAQDTICMPQSHGLMVFSKASTDLAIHFLQHGWFVAKP